MSTLREYKLIPVKESVTELYLDNHLDLPETLEVEEIATASFTIHNLEYKTEHYRYIVTQTTDIDTNIISSGSAKLNHDQYRSIKFPFTVASEEAKTKIEIRLPEKNQSIHFWINNNYGR